MTDSNPAEKAAAPGSAPFEKTWLNRKIVVTDGQGNQIGHGIVTDENEHGEVYIKGFLHGEEVEDWTPKSSLSDVEGGD